MAKRERKLNVEKLIKQGRGLGMLETWELPHIAETVTTNKVGKTYFIGAARGGAWSRF